MYCVCNDWHTQTNLCVYLHVQMWLQASKGTDWQLEQILQEFIYWWSFHNLIYKTKKILRKLIPHSFCTIVGETVLTHSNPRFPVFCNISCRILKSTKTDFPNELNRQKTISNILMCSKSAIKTIKQSQGCFSELFINKLNQFNLLF